MGMGSAVQQIKSLGPQPQPQPVGGKGILQSTQRPQQPGNLTAGEAMGLPGYGGGSSPQPVGGKGGVVNQGIRQAQKQGFLSNPELPRGSEPPPEMLMQTADINPATGMPSIGGVPDLRQQLPYDPRMIQRLPAPSGPLQQLPPTATGPRDAFGPAVGGGYSQGLGALMNQRQPRLMGRQFGNKANRNQFLGTPDGDEMNQMVSNPAMQTYRRSND